MKKIHSTYSDRSVSIVYQAANRQNHIDQGQSLNIIVHPDMPTKDINKIHIKLEVRTKIIVSASMNAAQKFKQKKECVSCEG